MKNYLKIWSFSLFLLFNFQLYSQTLPGSIKINQLTGFKLSQGESIHSVLYSADGANFTIATSKVSILLKSTSYFVYQGAATLGPFEHYIQSGNKWEAYNGSGNYPKTNHYAGTAKSHFQCPAAVDLSKVTVFNDSAIFVDYKSQNTPNEYYTGTEVIPIKQSINFPYSGDLPAYIKINKNGTSSTNSVVFNNRTLGTYDNAYSLAISPDRKSIAYYGLKVTNAYQSSATVYAGNKTYGPFTVDNNHSVSSVSWSPDSSQIVYCYVQNTSGSRSLTVYKDGKAFEAVSISSSDAFGRPIWSPDGKHFAFWLRNPNGEYYIFVDGNGKAAGPFVNEPKFIDFAFGDNTLAYFADGMLHIGNEFLRLSDYNDNLKIGYSHSRQHFFYYNGKNLVNATDFEDVFDRIPYINYARGDNFMVLGFKESNYRNEYPNTYSIFSNNSRKDIAFDADYYDTIFSPDGTQFAVLFQDTTSDQEYVYSDDGGRYTYTKSTSLDYYIPGMAKPKNMYNLRNKTSTDEALPLLPYGWTQNNIFVYVTHKANGYYVVENEAEFGPYDTIIDNGTKPDGNINWAALSGGQIYNITSK
jgi:hypothetical protein